MTTASDPETGPVPETIQKRRLYRSNKDRVVAGVSGGLGEYFELDPVWIRIAFVLLTLGGGSGILIYLVMWLLIPTAPEGYEPAGAPPTAGMPGTAIVGLVLIVVGSMALVNTVAPWLGKYFWPIALLAGGLVLVLGGVSRDRNR